MPNPGDYADNGPVTLVAAADSNRASRVPITAGFVTVSAYTTNANDWIVLPTGVNAGHTVSGYSAVGHEIRTEASSGVKINDVDSDGTQEAAITATWNWEARYLGATGWVLKVWTKLAAVATPVVPD